MHYVRAKIERLESLMEYISMSPPGTCSMAMRWFLYEKKWKMTQQIQKNSSL